MEKTICVRKNETVNRMGDKIVLYYFARERKVQSGEFLKKLYTIGVEMYTQQYGMRSVKESKVIGDVSSDKYEAEKIVDMLCNRCVTPQSLPDIICDYMSEKAI